MLAAYLFRGMTLQGRGTGLRAIRQIVTQRKMLVASRWGLLYGWQARRKACPTGVSRSISQESSEEMLKQLPYWVSGRVAALAAASMPSANCAKAFSNWCA